mmetsp:Transcript_47708/g.123710  ORF Transcript_47708/g.123710 Transcript_47708/m.123710 type:complete len:310 (-) Transcript_47708:164-1093(-)
MQSFAGVKNMPHPLFVGSAAEKGDKMKNPNPFAKFIITGSVTFAWELFGGHTLEFMKVMKQTTNDSYGKILKDMVANKGIMGALDGFLPWGGIQALIKGAVIGGAHAAAKRALKPVPMSDRMKEIAAGGIGGGVQGLVLSPFLLLKTRVMTDPAFRAEAGLLQTAVHSTKIGARVVANEGPATLMKGATVFSLKRVADWSTRFIFVDLVEHTLFEEDAKKKNLSFFQSAVASLGGGTLSVIVTLPLDVLVANIQKASEGGKKTELVRLLREQGLGLATKGFVARVAHVAITTMVVKTVSSRIYEAYLNM